MRPAPGVSDTLDTEGTYSIPAHLACEIAVLQAALFHHHFYFNFSGYPVDFSLPRGACAVFRVVHNQPHIAHPNTRSVLMSASECCAVCNLRRGKVSATHV